MFRRAEGGGFDGDDRQPGGRREPYPQDSLGGWSQLPIVPMQRAEEAILLTEVNDIGIFRQIIFLARGGRALGCMATSENLELARLQFEDHRAAYA